MPLYYGDKKDTVIGFKYFRLSGRKTLIVRTRGTADVRFEVHADDICLSTVTLKPGREWSESSVLITYNGDAVIYFRYLGTGKLDFREFELREKSEATARSEIYESHSVKSRIFARPHRH